MISRRDTLALLCGAPLAAAVTNWSHDQQGARFELTDGSGEIHWISASSFRVVRRWPDSAPHTRSSEHSVDFTATDAGEHVLLTTKYLSVRISKASFRLKVETTAGDEVLLQELTPAAKSTDGTCLNFGSRADEEYFGLGPRGDANLSARGSRVDSEWPLLISSAGFGMFHSGASRFDFDFSGGHRVLGRQADRVDYCFYYGPSPKEVLEEHKQVRPMRASGLYDYGVRKPGLLPREATMLPGATVLDLVRAANHAAMSGLHVPAIDLARLGDSSGMRQLAAVMPVVLCPSAPAGLAQMRAKLAPYFVTYVQEADDRGLPMLHPLPLQFPADREAIKHNDAFLLGDELLVAPLTENATRRQVYLPNGLVDRPGDECGTSRTAAGGRGSRWRCAADAGEERFDCADGSPGRNHGTALFP